MNDSATPTTSQPGTVLVVDDTPTNLSLMSDLLGDLYTGKVAKAGSTAAKLARSVQPPDLHLLQNVMPEMGGGAGPFDVPVSSCRPGRGVSAPGLPSSCAPAGLEVRGQRCLPSLPLAAAQTRWGEGQKCV